MWLTGFDVPSCSNVYLDKPLVEVEHDKATNDDRSSSRPHARRCGGAGLQWTRLPSSWNRSLPIASCLLVRRGTLFQMDHGVRRSIDNDSDAIRVTPRRSGSTWEW
jgi:hypothetical protein